MGLLYLDYEYKYISTFPGGNFATLRKKIDTIWQKQKAKRIDQWLKHTPYNFHQNYTRTILNILTTT